MQSIPALPMRSFVLRFFASLLLLRALGLLHTTEGSTSVASSPASSPTSAPSPSVAKVFVSSSALLSHPVLTSTAVTSPSRADGGGLTAEVIVGIVVGSVAGLLIFTLGLLLWRKERARREEKDKAARALQLRRSQLPPPPPSLSPMDRHGRPFTFPLPTPADFALSVDVAVGDLYEEVVLYSRKGDRGGLGEETSPPPASAEVGVEAASTTDRRGRSYSDSGRGRAEGSSSRSLGFLPDAPLSDWSDDDLQADGEAPHIA